MKFIYWEKAEILPVPFSCKTSGSYIDKCTLNKYFKPLKGWVVCLSTGDKGNQHDEELSASNKISYLRNGQFRAKWEKWDINSELNVGSVLN